MIDLIRKYMPTVYSFLKGFFSATDNKPGGQSLRKWLAIGAFWLIAIIVYRFTDSNNAVAMAGVLVGLITSLIITYTVGNHFEKTTPDKPVNPPKSTDESAG